MKVYIDIKDASEFRCETCDISKITRKSPPNIDINECSGILELMYEDLVKSAQTESFGGTKYFMTLVDDSSGMHFTYFLKSKK